MRSRFSAFELGDARYLLETWHPSTRPDYLDLDDQVQWTRLDIVAAVDGGPFDTSGVVEFQAHYRNGDTRSVQHEHSTFARADGHWRYVGGALERSRR